jgi:hypothetical protein
MSQNKCKVEWWSVVPGLTKVEPVQSATKFLPLWFKNMPKFIQEDNFKDKGTLKNCPGFVDYYKNAYVVTMWCDFHLKVTKNEFAWHSSNEDFTMSLHYDEQFKNYLPENVKDKFLCVAKTDCPWRVRTSPGWAMMQLPMFYDFNEYFECMPGVTHTEWSHQINQQLLIKKEGEFLIEKGTPLAMYIPIRLTELETTVQDEDQEKYRASFVSNMIFQSKFRGAYKNFMKKWSKE